MRMADLVAAAMVMVTCVLYYFLTFFIKNLFPELAAHNKSSMIVVFFTVNKLPIAGSVFTVCVFKRGI